MKLILALILLCCPLNLQAVTFDANSAGDTGGGTAVSLTHTVTAGGSNRAVFCGITTYSNTSTFSSVTYGAQTMTSHSREVGDLFIVTEVYKLVNPPTGLQTFSATIDASTQWTAGCVSFTDVDQTTPAGTAVTNNTTGTSSSVDVANTSPDIVLDFIGASQNTSQNWTFTLGGGQTPHWNVENDDTVQGSSREGGTGTVTMSWTLNDPGGSCYLAHTAFAVKTATTGSAVPVIVYTQ